MPQSPASFWDLSNRGSRPRQPDPTLSFGQIRRRPTGRKQVDVSATGSRQIGADQDFWQYDQFTAFHQHKWMYDADSLQLALMDAAIRN